MKQSLRYLISTSSAAVTYSLTGLLLKAQAITFCPEDQQLAGLCGSKDPDTVFNRILQYLFIAAAIIAIVFLIWGGIKWITSGGDKAKVESARNTIIGAIIGLVVVFASFFIINVVLKTFFGFEVGGGGFKLPGLTE